MLGIEAIDEQFIVIGTKDYDLVIDITGNPDTVKPKGLTEGFDHHWDETNSQLHIKAAEVTRLIAGVFWDIELKKGEQMLEGKIRYNVIPAAPIFETLPTIYLYRGVPINFDILIHNIPDLIRPQSLLISLKSELQEYGLNFKGFIPTGANYAVDADTLQIIVPSDTGETSDMHDYPYVIESGSPPAIGDVEVTPSGNFAELSFDAVNHALGYEWSLEDGDDETWNIFNNTRNIINPSEVEITPGNLNVTISFPNIAGASSYEYQLVSETSETQWIGFAGILSNGRISTIIPGLEEGVGYKLRLRVASPWVGTPIELTVYGGRLIYALHEDSTSADKHALYVFSTGTAQNAVASTIKRILLPDDLNTPADFTIDFENNHFYIADISDKSVHVFNLNTAHDTQATRIRKFFKPSTLSSLATLAFYNGVLYGSGTSAGTVESFSANTANGQVAARINRYSTTIINAENRASDISDELIYFTSNPSTSRTDYIVYFERTPLNFDRVSSSEYRIRNAYSGEVNFALLREVGMSVVGDIVYVSGDAPGLGAEKRIYFMDLTKNYDDPEQRARWFLSPQGCNRIVGLVVAR